MMRLLCFAVLCLGLFSRQSAAIAIDDLRAGGYAVFFRHTERDPDHVIGEPIEAVDLRQECRPGTQLNATGWRNAERIHAKLASFRIPVAKTFASPTCRTIEMARILSGSAFELTRALVYPKMFLNAHEGRQLMQLLRRLMAATPATANRLFLSHAKVLPSAGLLASTRDLRVGDAAIFRPDGRGGVTFVGVIPAAQWTADDSAG